MGESSQSNNLESSIEPIAESLVRNFVGNFGNGDENLSIIQSPDENNDQYQMDIYDQNNIIETHRETRV